MPLIAVLAGDGIGPEVTAEARRVLEALGLGLDFEEAPVGGAAYLVSGHPLPPETLALAKRADAILFGAVGDPRFENLDRHLRPEAALLGIRSALGLFANIRPATLFPGLEAASPLKPEVVAGLDIVILHELTGDVYFGEKGQRTDPQGRRQGYDVMSYTDYEIERIARVGFEMAKRRRRKLCSIDKANVLETSQVWRDVVNAMAAEYPEVALQHMYVDNAAMQLVRRPADFDVIVTGNLFDQASMCAGSIGMLPSASLNAWSGANGMYEPIHGSAPDIAGQGKANPCAAILSAAMLLRHSLSDDASAQRIERAVTAAIAGGARTADLGGSMSTRAMGDAVLGELA
jgi:3-isopropylmalate dehydrogenase